MSSVSEAAPARSVILKPYTPDPERKAHKRMRLLVIVLVSLFCVSYGFAFALMAPYLMLPLLAPPVVLGLVVIWALPETRTAPMRSLVWLTFAFFIGLVCWPNYIAFAPPGLPWITMVRITGVPLVIVLLLCVSMSADFRARVAWAVSSAPLVWKLLIGFVLIQTITIVFSKNVGQSFDRYIVAQMTWTAMFFISAYVFTKPGRVELMAAMLWGMAIFVGVIAIQEWRHAGVLWAGHIPGFLRIPDPSVDRALAFHQRGGDGIYRAQSTFTTALGLGEYVALTLPLVLQFAFGAYRWPVKLAAFASIPLMLFTVYASGSRLGTIGCLMSFGLYALVWSVMHWREKRDSLVGPAAVMVFPIGAAAFLILSLVWNRLHTMVWGGGQAALSTLARQEQLKMAIPKLLTHPWGYGISMGAYAVGYYIPGGDLTLDSYYITVAMEYGVLGFLVYYGFFACCVFYALKFKLAAPRNIREYEFLTMLAIAIANFFVIKSVFSQQENHPIAFMYAGMIVALGARVMKERSSKAA